MKLRRTNSLISATVLAVSSVLSLGFAPLAHAAASTCTWTGAGGDGKFSTVANWSNCNGAAPVGGDVIAFPSNGTNSYTLTNDLATTVALGGVTIGTANSTDNTNYIIDKLHLADGAVITTISGADIGISGSVTADGGLVFNGNPFFSVQAVGKDIPVNFTNVTYNNAPEACHGGGGTGYAFNWVPSGVATVGSGSAYTLNGTESSVVVQSGGALNLPYSTGSVTYAGDITFQGGGTTQGSLCGTSISLNARAKSTTLSGKITLSGGDILYSVNDGDTLTVTGDLEGTGNALKKASNSAGTFVNAATTNNSATPGGTQEVPITTLPPITDDKPTQSLFINPKTIVTLDGTRGEVTVSQDATLKGNGTAQDLYVSGTVAPGHSPGKLTVVKTLNLEDGSVYQAELKDKTAGDYDQIVVGSASDTSPDVWITNGSLDVSLYKGYKINKGDQFTIINDLGKAAIQGTFKGLPEGATFKVGNGTFKISYKGGTGNDVVLTAMDSISAPDTGFALAAAHPEVTLLGTLLAAGAIFGLAQFTRKATNRR